MRIRRGSGTPADALRPLLFGDVAVDGWQGSDDVGHQEPWVSFRHARALSRSGHVEYAIRIWQQIVDSADIESRHTLQAWHFLRANGVEPPATEAATVLGAVAEVAVSDGHDLLVAYRDGEVRYLNHAGNAAVVTAPSAPPIAEAITTWLIIAQTLAAVVGVWDQATLPALPPGASRVLMLTPAGKRFGQGPDAQLRQDPGAGQFLAAATQLLVLVAPGD